jgi:hypothetical protein
MHGLTLNPLHRIPIVFYSNESDTFLERWITWKRSSRVESSSSVVQSEIGLCLNFSKGAPNAKTFCYIAAHVTTNFLVSLEAVDRRNPAITIASFSPTVRVRTTGELRQKPELVQHMAVPMAVSYRNLSRTWWTTSRYGQTSELNSVQQD